MSLWTRLKLVFTHGQELEDIVKAIEFTKRSNKNLLEGRRLNLCHMHRQEANYSDYSEDNCDYCKVIKHLYSIPFRPLPEWLKEKPTSYSSSITLHNLTGDTKCNTN